MICQYIFQLDIVFPFELSEWRIIATVRWLAGMHHINVKEWRIIATVRWLAGMSKQEFNLLELF